MKKIEIAIIFGTLLVPVMIIWSILYNQISFDLIDMTQNSWLILYKIIEKLVILIISGLGGLGIGCMLIKRLIKEVEDKSQAVKG